MKKILMHTCFSMLLGAIGFSHAEGIQADNSLNYVFKSGTEGYHTYRIPAIVAAKDGTLVAFAEGRVNNWGDHGNIDLVAKRSTDGGKTWGKLIVVRDDENRTCGNPAPVVDQKSGVIYLISCGSAGSEQENMAGKKPREVYLQKSTNGGKTWTTAKKITNQAKKDSWGWFATGPCNAIQIQTGKYKGRIVVPSNMSEKDDQDKVVYRGSCFYSDDLGKTWKIGETSADGCNESTIAEVAPNLLVQNFRMQSHSKGKRAQRYSKDGGATWTPIEHVDDLFCCRCQGSIVRDYARPELLYFSNPSKGGRNALKLQASKDGGKTWPLALDVYDKRSGYSNVVVPTKDTVGVLFEGGINDIAAGIAYKSFKKSELKDKNEQK